MECLINAYAHIHNDMFLSLDFRVAPSSYHFVPVFVRGILMALS